MQAVIYAGLRNPGRDQLIFNALIRNTVSEVAEEFSCAPSTIRAAAKRIADLNVYELRLTGGGKDIPVGQVAAKSFRRAALGAYRHFCGTFRHLELPTWSVTDGTNTISIQDLRNLDSGCASVTEDDKG
ncbi:MAG: hypothetical protein AB7E55_07735 [Pigmentiphaga sp.]